MMNLAPEPVCAMIEVIRLTGLKRFFLCFRRAFLSAYENTPLVSCLPNGVQFIFDLGPILENSDTFFRNGPKNTYEQEVWSKWFKAPDKDSVELSLNTKDFGEDFQDKFNNLFRAARRIMDKIYTEYGSKSHNEVISLTHSAKVCPEWGVLFITWSMRSLLKTFALAMAKLYKKLRKL